MGHISSETQRHISGCQILEPKTIHKEGFCSMRMDEFQDPLPFETMAYQSDV
jgi:hypothetical protein